YLRTLSNLFGGDWHLALASYNGGPGRLQRAMKLAHVEDFWKLSEKPKVLPRETREYVPMILAAIVIPPNPSQYGFDVEPRPPPTLGKGHAASSGGPPARREMGRRPHRRVSGPHPGTPPMDDACSGQQLRVEGSRRHRRHRRGKAGRRAGHGSGVVEVLHRE